MSGELHILGAGSSGLAAARLAASKGWSGRVFSETAPAPETQAELERIGFRWSDTLTSPESEALVVVSPGFADTHPWIRELMQNRRTLISELQCGADALKGTLVVITGSLGKTSMVQLAAELLRDASYSVEVSGNSFRPVSEAALVSPQADFHVIEASSFQLEHTEQLSPERAICLNLFPNHLDRHGSVEAYARAKGRLFQDMRSDAVAVWPETFPVEIQTCARRAHVASVPLPKLEGSIFERGALRENLQALMAGLDGIEGVDAFRQEEVIRSFAFPPHRMQRLSLPGFGTVVNDSKSTCFSATRAALEQVPGRVWLIMGGIDKDEDPGTLTPHFSERNPKLMLYGQSAKKMRLAWQDSVDLCAVFATLRECICEIRNRRKPSEPVLFSPGCASFDQYRNFAQRGEQFETLMQEWIQNP